MGAIDPEQEWNKECFSCTKHIKNGPMYQAVQQSTEIFICYACEFNRPKSLIDKGVDKLIYIKLENDGHLEILDKE